MTESETGVATTLGWMREGERFVAGTAEALSDEALREPSALPGWTRAHVVAHLARNAEALGRLAAWARTGVETPMYTGPEQRNADIEASATLPAATLRAELVMTARALDAALAAFDDATWRAPVRSAQGKDIPAAEIPWMRAKEVWLHAVDLGAPLTLPEGMAGVLLDDVTGVLSGREGCPSLLLRAPVGEWRLGPDEPTAVLEGSAPALAGWLTGRTRGADLTCSTGAVPAAPRWL